MKNLLLLLLFLSSALHTAVAEQVLLIGGRVVDVNSGRLVDQSILITNRRIDEIGNEVEVPQGAKVIDMTGKYLMPGLIDAHSHVAASALLVAGQAPGSLMRQNFEISTAERAVRATANLQSLLASGFTTIRDVGLGGNLADIAVADGVEEGWIAGPRVIASGKIIGPLGTHANAGLNPEQPGLQLIDHIITHTSDEMRAAVRWNMQHGAAAIKLVVEHGLLSYTEDEIRVAVDEANRAGLRVAAHSFSDRATQNAIRAGVTSIEHGFNISDETLRMMVKNGVWLVDTTFAQGSLDIATPQNASRWIQRLKRAHQLGVQIAYGSDVFWHEPGRTRGEVSLDNIESYELAGISNEEILRYITINAADVIGVKSETGSLEPGKSADIIALDENPLDSVQALRQVSFVMKAGTIYKREDRFAFEPTGFGRTREAVSRDHAIND